MPNYKHPSEETPSWGSRLDVQPGRVDAKPAVERLAMRFAEVAQTLGVSRRLLERELSAGRFMKPDLYIGRVPLWRVESIRAWLAEQAAEQGGRS
jgi:hypothetical protein